ncbi:MAG TPA: BamA/TamA family outer membrane protein [Gemmatimonadaceae bacterium]
MISVALLVSAVLVQGATSPDSTPRPKTTVLPVVSYSEVTGFQYGATVRHGFRSSSDSSTRASSLVAYAAHTAKDYWKWYVQSDLWWGGNTRHWRSRVEYISYPLPFFGIGGSAPDSAEEWYSSGVLTVHMFAQRAVRPGTYIHAGGRYVRSQLREWEDGGLLSSNTFPGVSSTSVWTAELGVVVDTRDNLVTPRAGTYARIIPSLASKAFGSDFAFRRLTVDWRSYGTLGRFTTAKQVQYDGVAGGSLPFDQLPMIGSDTAMRGYPRGRYRDRHAITMQMEFRTPHWRRAGAVAFFGAGSVSNALTRFDSENWFLNAGVGLRYVLLPKDRTVARVDFGIGRGSFGINLGIGEAF